MHHTLAPLFVTSHTCRPSRSGEALAPFGSQREHTQRIVIHLFTDNTPRSLSHCLRPRSSELPGGRCTGGAVRCGVRCPGWAGLAGRAGLSRCSSAPPRPAPGAPSSSGERSLGSVRLGCTTRRGAAVRTRLPAGRRGSRPHRQASPLDEPGRACVPYRYRPCTCAGPSQVPHRSLTGPVLALPACNAYI